MGRRLFDQPTLIGAAGQKKPAAQYNLRNFQESRETGFSLDRLGRTNPEAAALRYLEPRAKGAASKLRPAKEFHGWATIQAKKLQDHPRVKFDVRPSPISGEGLVENIYHAEADCRSDRYDLYSIALHLKHLFESQGVIQQPQNENESPNEDPGFVRRCLLMFSGSVTRFANRFR